MKIVVNLTADVFKRFTYFDMLRRRKMWRSPAIFASIMCVCAVICYLMHRVDGAILLGTVLLLVGLGMPLVYLITFSFSVRSQISALGLKTPQQVYTITLTERSNGISADKGKEHADYEWKQVHHAYRDRSAVYLYITPQRAFILPHDCTPEGADALWSLLVKKLSDSRCTVLHKKG